MSVAPYPSSAYFEATDFGYGNTSMIALPQYSEIDYSPKVDLELTNDQITTPGVFPADAVYSIVQSKRVYSKHPTSLICQHCNTRIVTDPKAKVGLITWLVAGCMLFTGLVPCCILPFFIDDCKDIHHQCPNCHYIIDVFKII